METPYTVTQEEINTFGLVTITSDSGNGSFQGIS